LDRLEGLADRAGIEDHALFSRTALPGEGPLYLQVKRLIEDAIQAALISNGDALPSERDIAARLSLSRVTVRKAIRQLAEDGVLVQRRGSGTFVASRPNRVEQSLSQLTSFTEDMARRGMAVHAALLDAGIYPPSPQETVALGLSNDERVARIRRLRLTGNTPLAIERASLSERLLPDPQSIGASLYEYLDRHGNRPVRAIQRIRAVTTSEADAALLQVSPGAPSLDIERTSYSTTGRVVEFTRSTYRGDTYDFIAELRLGEKDHP
jgi:GntR family transcriptional regulator